MLLTVESTQKIRTKINLSPDFHRVHYLRRMVDRDNEHVSSIQLLIHVQLFPTPWTAAHQASLSITNSRSLLKLKSIESVMPFNHFTLVVPFSSCLQSFPTSGSFPMSQFFASGGQNIGVSASTSVLPMIFRVDFL